MTPFTGAQQIDRSRWYVYEQRARWKSVGPRVSAEHSSNQTQDQRAMSMHKRAPCLRFIVVDSHNVDKVIVHVIDGRHA